MQFPVLKSTVVSLNLGRNLGWGCSRLGCWGYSGSRGKRYRSSLNLVKLLRPVCTMKKMRNRNNYYVFGCGVSCKKLIYGKVLTILWSNHRKVLRKSSTIDPYMILQCNIRLHFPLTFFYLPTNPTEQNPSWKANTSWAVNKNFTLDEN